MRPLSFDLPKPMMPLWGRPVLEHVLRLLADWGARDVTINAHHQPGEILEFVRRAPVPGVRVALSFEPDLLGAGGALQRARWALREPFWLVNADIAMDLDPSPLVRAFTRRTLAAVWLDAERGPRTVDMGGGLVRGFASRRPGGEDTYTLCGVHLVSPRVLNFLPPSGFSTITRAYAEAIARGQRVAGVCVPRSFWADLGAPDSYLDAHRSIRAAHFERRPGARLFDPAMERRAQRARRDGARISGFAAFGDGVRVRPGARIEDSVVWDGATLESDAVVRGAVIGRGARVRGAVPSVALRAEVALDRAERRAMARIAWPLRDTTAIPMAPRGSARTYTRLQRGGRGILLMRYSVERAENALFCRHARFLAGIGFPVPRVLLDDARNRLALLEDLGDEGLLDAARDASSRRIRGLYARVLDHVLALHRRGAAEARRARLRLMPRFDGAGYRWERDFFARHFLESHLRLPAARVRAIKREMATVAARLAQAPRVLIHRDLQSSNILLRGGRPFFLDFQGMRYGPAVYDLASLLCDPYVNLDDAARRTLLEYYAARSGNARAVRELFWWAAIERLAQALGAYVRLGALPGMQRFLSYVPPALRILLRALEDLPGCPALRACALAALEPAAQHEGPPSARSR
jgi:NDP-sugar pyrophosphorylase family protein/tRNA A-37 threonylcarbamoyl transferase component Bud32